MWINPKYDKRTIADRFTIDDKATEGSLRLEYRANQWQNSAVSALGGAELLLLFLVRWSS